MLTYEECLEMSDLDQLEIDAIAEHEHMETMIAMALGHYLVTHDGEIHIKEIILDDIHHAQACNNLQRVTMLNATLLKFVKGHPKAMHA